MTIAYVMHRDPDGIPSQHPRQCAQIDHRLRGTDIAIVQDMNCRETVYPDLHPTLGGRPCYEKQEMRETSSTWLWSLPRDDRIALLYIALYFGTFPIVIVTIARLERVAHWDESMVDTTLSAMALWAIWAIVLAAIAVLLNHVLERAAGEVIAPREHGIDRAP